MSQGHWISRLDELHELEEALDRVRRAHEQAGAADRPDRLEPGARRPEGPPGAPGPTIDARRLARAARIERQIDVNEEVLRPASAFPASGAVAGPPCGGAAAPARTAPPGADVAAGSGAGPGPSPVPALPVVAPDAAGSAGGDAADAFGGPPPPADASRRSPDGTLARFDYPDYGAHAAIESGEGRPVADRDRTRTFVSRRKSQR